MTQNARTRDQHDREADDVKERASATTDPAKDPGPRGNPSIEADSVARGKEKLERVKPY
jgi:hypothetical protein